RPAPPPSSPLFPYTTLFRSGLAWVHAMIGLHSIVKLRAWYPRAAPWLLGVVVLVPTLAILGFVNGGRQAAALARDPAVHEAEDRDRKSTRLNSSHVSISYAV